MLRPVLAWRAFLNLWTVYLFNFPFLGGRGQTRVTETADTESAYTAVHLYSTTYLSRVNPVFMLDFKLSPCSKCCILAFGWYPGVGNFY
jgi:hypothetical protein